MADQGTGREGYYGSRLARGKEVLSDEDRYQLQQLAQEKDLLHLWRKYILLESQARHSGYSKHSKLIQTSKIIDAYTHEYREILNDLGPATAPGRHVEDDKTFDHLTQLLLTCSLLKTIIDKSKSHLKEVGNEMKQVKKRCLILEKQQDTDTMMQRRIWAAMKTVETLENKLETHNIQFGTICWKNKKMREKIDLLLWERRLFVNTWNKLINKLVLGRRVMLDIIEQATIAYNQREDWLSKLNLLQKYGASQLAKNIQLIREYSRKVDDNTKLMMFLKLKGQKRILKELEEKRLQKRLEFEQSMREKLELYQEMVNDIKTLSKEEKIHTIVAKFIKNDEVNMSNFRFIIFTIGRAETYTEQLHTLSTEIDVLRALQTVRGEVQGEKLRSLESQLEESKEQNLNASAKLTKSDAELNALLGGIGHLFSICKCDKESLLNLLGDNSKIRDCNALLYIQILEQRVCELLLEASYQDRTSEKKKKAVSSSTLIRCEDRPRLITVEEYVDKTPCSLCVAHQLMNDVVDKATPVFDRNSANEKLQESLKTPAGMCMHSVSKCMMPEARQIMQQRYY